MPSSWRTDRIRQSWQPRQLTGAPARIWLILRRTAATLLALGLIGVCGWLLFSLIWVPKTYLAYWTATTYQPLAGQPLAFVSGDFEAIKRLEPALAASDLPDPFETPLTKAELENRLREIAAWPLRGKDTLIVFLTAHGVVRGDEAGLRCESGQEDGGTVTFPIAALLEALEQIPAGTKLLILDAGRDQDQPRIGMPLNNFPLLLKRAVEEASDPRLWVLSAHAPLERSHVSASRRQSVFGHVLSRALAGGADENGDHKIALDELYDHMQTRVGEWLKKTTDGLQTQTPVLFHCDAEKLERVQLAKCFVVSTRRLPDLSEVAEFEIPEELASAADIVGQVSDSSTENDGDGKAEAGSESEDEAPSSTSGTDYAAGPLRRRREAWSRVEDIQKAPLGDDPVVVVPPRWRTDVDRMFWYEQFFQTGLPASRAYEKDWARAKSDLDSILTNLTTYVPSEAQSLPLGNPTFSKDFNPFSMAMAERLSAYQPDRALAADLTAFATSYDGWLAHEKDSSFKTLDALGQDKEVEDENVKSIETRRIYYEFQLLPQLRSAKMPWPLVRSVLHTRRIAEQVAADPLCGAGWAQDAVERADLLRWEGERLILDQTHTAWEDESAMKLDDARLRYADATRTLSRVRNAFEQRDQVLVRALHYVRWAHLSGNIDREIKGDVLKLFANCEALSKGLAHPAPESVPQLTTLAAQLEEQHTKLDKRLASPRNPGEIESLLHTTLPSAALRDEIRRRWAEAERQRVPDDLTDASGKAAAPISTLTDQQRNQLKKQYELELALARLAGCDEDGVSQVAKTLNDSQANWDVFQKAAGDIAKLHADAQKSVSDRIQEVIAAKSAERRSELAGLRDALCRQLLAGGMSRQKLDVAAGLVTALNQAAWQDQFAWHGKRARRAANDAPEVEAAFLQNGVEQFGKLAGPTQSGEASSAAPSSLKFEAASRIAMDMPQAVRTSIPFRLRATREMSARLVAQFDPELLEVGGDVPSGSADYPVDPDRTVQEATELSGSEISGTINVTRKRNARGTTKLILKAVGGKTGETVVRHEIEVVLPGHDVVDLAVNATGDLWSRRQGEAILYLHPFPNREQDYSFSVVNHSGATTELKVEFFIPESARGSRREIIIPTGAQQQATADALLEALGPMKPLGPAIAVKLESGQSSQRLIADPNAKPGTNLLLEAGQDPIEFRAPRIGPEGMVVVMTDAALGVKTIRNIQIMPQRPRIFLQAVARYDANSRRLRVDVAARNRNAVPRTGLPVSLVVDPASVSNEAGIDDQGVIESPDYMKSMYVHLSHNAPAKVRAHVDVNGYPRAFIFDVSSYTSNPRIDPLDNVRDVRITSPQPRTPYQAPRREVPVEFQVDAPGSFGENDRTSFVEVGFDADQDGEFRNERTETLRSDRQVEVDALGLLPDGSLKLFARVSDFKQPVPVSGRHQTGDLLARLVTRQGESKSQPVEIILDGQGPSLRPLLYPVNVQRERKIESGVDLEVWVSIVPPDLSEVVTVETTFETTRAGDAAEPKWTEAKRMPDGKWLAKLPTKDILGWQTVLTRAVDIVGNKSTGPAERVQIVPPRAAAAPAGQVQDVSNRVTGRVLYVREGVAAEVILETATGEEVARQTTRADGRFDFPKVPPGSYAVKATSAQLHGGDLRKGQTEDSITVHPRPAPETKVPPISLR